MRRALSVLALLALSAGGLTTTTVAGAGETTTVAVRLEPGVLARAGVTASFFERYGAFDWAVVDSGDVGVLRAAGAEVHPEAGTLVLPSTTFDPLREPPAALGFASGRPFLHLVQFHGPIKDAWLDQVRASGAELVQYVAPFSYVVLLDPADRPAIAALRPVRWVGAFASSYRFGNLDLMGASLANALLIDDGRVDASLGLLRALGVPVKVTTTEMPFQDVTATGIQVPASALAVNALVRLPNVYSISPQLSPHLRDEMSDQIVAGNYNASSVPQTGFRTWLTAQGVTGAGVVVAHVDSGADLTHPDLQFSMAGCRDYVAAGALCTFTGVPSSNDRIGINSDTLGHGTHTAGIIAGRGLVPATDASGFQYGLGVAPGAKLYVQNYVSLAAPFGPSGPGQYQSLNRDSVLGGATISANSWGPAGTPQGYDADTREFDMAPRDANLTTSGHEPLAFVLSIMNGSGGTSTQGSPDEGKNLLRVGGTKNYRAGGIKDLCTCSAHGPALDGRRLPDVVAPGENVISTRSSAAVPVFCGVPVADAEGALYASCTGTSMASPHVSGASALFTEWYKKQFATNPSPALQKAAFVNGAVDLAGGRDADNGVMGHIPDNKQGWGRMNLSNTFGGTQKAYVDQTVVFHDTGESWSGTIEPVDPSQPVKVTLAWTDAPGAGLGGATPAWVNDLDLRVTSGEGAAAVTYLGNAFGSPSTGWSVPGGAADFRNNLENVYLQSASGPLTVEVLAANIAGDAIFGDGDDTDQDFALVISNGRLT
ncbi:MAG TPA: S8 family serine peptidase [Actinomycetota bacterium]